VYRRGLDWLSELLSDSGCDIEEVKWFFCLFEDIDRFVLESCWIEDFPFFETDILLFALYEIEEYIHDRVEHHWRQVAELSKESEVDSIVESCCLHDVSFLFEELERLLVDCFDHLLGHFSEVEVGIGPELRLGSLEIVVSLEEDIDDIVVQRSLDPDICDDR
jgi:hypothetical protein